MTIQSGERSILPFGVAEIDCAGFCRDRLKKDIFVKSKTHVIGRKRLSAVRNGGWVLLLVDRGFIWGHVSGKKSNSMRWQFSPLPGVRNSDWRIWQGIKGSRYPSGIAVKVPTGFLAAGRRQNFHPSSARGASGTRPCLLGKGTFG